MTEPNSPFDLSSKRVLVVGAAGLIGQSICEVLDHQNANLVLADTDAEKLSDLTQRLGSETPQTTMDITSDRSIQEARGEILNRWEKIDVLINTAYPKRGNYGAPMDDVTRRQWEDNLNAHLGGYFSVVNQLTDGLADGGSIVLMASIYASIAPDFSLYENLDMTSPVEYAGIKGGIVNLARYFATHLADRSIRVNTVSPGGVKDRDNQPDDFIERYEDKTPLGRMTKPEDVAETVAFLASDASEYITGQNIIVDGGYTIQ